MFGVMVFYPITFVSIGNMNIVKERQLMSKTSDYIKEESDENPYFDTVSNLYRELIEKDITIRKQQEVIDNLRDELNIWKHYH